MNIIIFYILFYSFHILQFLDVKCFGSLKVAYKKKIKKMMQMHFMHITKNNFFFVFKQAFFISISEKNVQAKFQMIGFMPYNLKIMINNLDFKLKTLTLSSFCLINAASTNPTTSKTTKDAVRSFIELKSKIIIHQNNFPS